MSKLLSQKIHNLKDEGFLDEYSPDHIIIKSFNNKFSRFDDCPFFLERELHLLGKSNELNGSNFLINLSTKLTTFEKIFDKNALIDFVTDQLAAGKENYDEEQFFRALSELHVIHYLSQYVSLKTIGQYEPKLIDGSKTNPEARLIFDEGDLIYDIEVKTGAFKESQNLDNSPEKHFRPNTILPKECLIKLKEESEKLNTHFHFPNILKLKDFIESASSKFLPLNDPKRLNLLFINWSYNDFKLNGLLEPIGLLTNNYSGLLRSSKAQKLVKLKSSSLENISGIVFYSDSVQSILSNDFRFHFADKSVFLVPVNMNQESIQQFTIRTNIALFDPNSSYLANRSEGLKKDPVTDIVLHSIQEDMLKNI